MDKCIECIFVEINQTNRKNILLGCIYRPSNDDRQLIDEFNIEFLEILKATEFFEGVKLCFWLEIII